MSYIHIQNLYKNPAILMFRECYALEKIHGTSAHVSWKDGKLSFYSGEEKHESFVALFDQAALSERFAKIGHLKCTIYGEAYGGKQQGMKDVYGPNLRFIAFDVLVGDSWLSVPDMTDVARNGLGIDVVPWEITPTDIEKLDAIRDRPSDQAKALGVGDDKIREGVVLRPLRECFFSGGERVIAKHKGDAFRERVHQPRVRKVQSLEVIEDSKTIADEWVTEMRLAHVLAKLPRGLTVRDTPAVIAAMVEDVTREASGEIVDSAEARRAIGTRAARLFHARLRS